METFLACRVLTIDLSLLLFGGVDSSTCRQTGVLHGGIFIFSSTHKLTIIGDLLKAFPSAVS